VFRRCCLHFALTLSRQARTLPSWWTS
jgi:hypothetical protein